MRPSPAPSPDTPRGALDIGRAHDAAGRLLVAATSYHEAVRLAEAMADGRVLAEALRRLGVVQHRLGAERLARDLCRQSHLEALKLSDPVLAGEGLNALGGFHFEAGEIAAARGFFLEALALGESSASLSGRVEQNLGILDSVQGRHDDACRRYRAAVRLFEQAGEQGGCAIAYHNLGLTALRRGELAEAEGWLDRSLAIARRSGDVYLEGLCLVHRAEISHARREYPDAMRSAQAALEGFERLRDRRAQSDACKVLGKIHRDTGRPTQAEERLRTAVALAVETDWLLGKAEASRELARLQADLGRRHDALSLLSDARDLFQRLEAQPDVEDVVHRIAVLVA
jgi:tetratricopeptide (TPR) repeat protein